MAAAAAVAVEVAVPVVGDDGRPWYVVLCVWSMLCLVVFLLGTKRLSGGAPGNSVLKAGGVKKNPRIKIKIGNLALNL